MKCEDLSNELESSQRECRNNSSELFRLRAAWDETVEQLDSVRRENKNLADEIKDLLDQLGEGGRSIHELDKQRRRLQVEKDELQLALEEAESALEQEENKVLRSQMDLAQAKQEIERRYYTKQITKDKNIIQFLKGKYFRYTNILLLVQSIFFLFAAPFWYWIIKGKNITDTSA